MPRATPVLLALLAALAAGCGGAPSDEGDAGGTCAVTPVEVPAGRGAVALKGLYYGQEIWISYQDAAFEGQGFRYPRTREEALAKARDLCREAHAGGDIGALARRWSNGDLGVARGLCVVPEDSHRAAPDARDLTLARTPPGQLTPLIEWRGGYWFARRIDVALGRELTVLLQHAQKVRARARVIHIHHAGAYPRRYEFDNFTKEQAVAKAWALIRELQRPGGPTFAELARAHCNDEATRGRDGLLTTRDPRTGQSTEWIRWGDRNFNQPMLEVILEKGTPGEVHPQPVVSGQGVDVVLVLERRDD